MKQMLLILNPIAGTKKAARYLTDIVSVFNRAGYDPHVYVTACRGDAVNAVKTLGKEAELIVCCGGDGTLNETVTGIVEGDIRTPVGYIPAGTTNDFANALHLSGDVVKAAKQVAEGTATPYDVGKFQDRYFTYVASFGAFTKASYNTPQNVKNALGHVAYVLEGIQELSKVHKEHIHIQLDDLVLDDDYMFCAVCNSTSVGGVLTLKPELVDMDDGMFEVILVRAPKDIQEMHEGIVALKNQNYNCGMITFKSASRISVMADPQMLWSLDGEKAAGAEKVCIENLHQRLMLVH